MLDINRKMCVHEREREREREVPLIVESKKIKNAMVKKISYRIL